MLFSVAIQLGLGNYSTNVLPTARLRQNRILPTLKTERISSFPRPINRKPVGVSASSSSIAREASDSELDGKNETGGSDKKLRVVVKALARPRLVLKFIWMEKNIGIAIDQVIPGGHGTIPVSPYYFWPRKDAWAELKAMLERKPWISSKEKVVLLNQATDIINLWQQSGEDSA